MGTGERDSRRSQSGRRADGGRWWRIAAAFVACPLTYVLGYLACDPGIFNTSYGDTQFRDTVVCFLGTLVPAFLCSGVVAAISPGLRVVVAAFWLLLASAFQGLFVVFEPHHGYGTLGAFLGIWFGLLGGLVFCWLCGLLRSAWMRVALTAVMVVALLLPALVPWSYCTTGQVRWASACESAQAAVERYLMSNMLDGGGEYPWDRVHWDKPRAMPYGTQGVNIHEWQEPRRAIMSGHTSRHLSGPRPVIGTADVLQWVYIHVWLDTDRPVPRTSAPASELLNKRSSITRLYISFDQSWSERAGRRGLPKMDLSTLRHVLRTSGFRREMSDNLRPAGPPESFYDVAGRSVLDGVVYNIKGKANSYVLSEGEVDLSYAVYIAWEGE